MDDTVTATPDDNVADRKLRLLVGLVVVVAAPVLAHAAWRAGGRLDLVLYAAVLTLLIAMSSAAHLSVRIRGNHQVLVSTSAAVLVGIALLPPAWVVVSGAVGVLVPLALRGMDPFKLSFNVGKEVLGVAAGAYGAAGLGLLPAWAGAQTQPLSGRIAALAAAAVGYTVVEELLVNPTVAIATRTPVRQRFLTRWDIRFLSRVGNFAIALATLAVLQVDRWLLAALPPLVFALHLAAAGRMRARAEREAWQRLAGATDELNTVDGLSAVLATAGVRATELFSADDVEIQLDSPPRLVRADSGGVRYDGPPGDAPPVPPDEEVIEAPLESQGEPPVGRLRLRFRGRVRLSEREHYTLRTFTAALCTAVRNATAYAEARRLAETHALAASQDPLTGLANRRRLHEYGTEVLDARAGRGVTALLLLDLNHFKEINDTLGHAAGDHVLVEVARRLSTAVEEADLVARLGGDEFAVIFASLPAPAVAVPRAERLLAALTPPMELDGMRIQIEGSAGVATSPVPGGVVELLRRADVAMYQAKRDGQKIAVYAPTRDTADRGSLALGGDLARAVAEEEFTVNFQPIVDLGSGEVIGAEALTRWHHPDHGDLAPARFLDAVERSGRLPAFAEAVLDQALSAAASWQAAGYPVPVSVNVSPRSLLDPAFPTTILAGLARHDVPPESLVVELTESVMLSKLEVVDEVLDALRTAGVRLALDDFGTGFSSLATLARVPVHEIKIDRSFVTRMNATTESAVIRSTVELGRSLGLVVVAEGVESEEQRRSLWELGCPAGQGHLFARPMPAAALLQVLRTGADGRTGALAASLHEDGAVIRMPAPRRGRVPNQRLGRGS
jgi:diguanylate cyclase (GGDEF)-like protein